jgi:2-succinyl-6-hydroxy-2,4-cyclohexadiene-1-carboxylate synthase
MAAQVKNPSILALHGFTGAGADFAPFSKLCTGTWHSPNLPGHGPKPEPDCSPVSTLRWIEDQRSTFNLQSSTPKILLGYSMGARAALLHACRHPEHWDVLILISPNPGIEADEERAKRRAVDARLARQIEEGGVASFLEFWQNTPMIRSQKDIRKDWREAMQANREQHTASGLAASLRQFGQGQCPNLWPELGLLTMPTLLLSGNNDRKYTRIAERMCQHLPLGALRTFDQAGHMPHLEAPEACAKAIRDFLETFA